MYRPAGEVNEVGGDFYDAFEIDGGWMVAIGDVMGRGAAAASLTGLARHTIRTAGRLTGDPRQARAPRRREPQAGSDLLLCSAIILVLPDTDQDPARIPILVAGHPPPLLVRDGRSSGRLQWPAARGAGRASTGSSPRWSSRPATSWSSTPTG